MSQYISEFNETVADVSQIIADDIKANTAEITAASIPTLVSTSITTTSAAVSGALTAGSATITSATITSATIPTLASTSGTFETVEVTTVQPFIDLGSVQYAGWNQFDIVQGTSTGNRMRHYVNVFDDAKSISYKMTGLYDSDMDTPNAADALIAFGSHKSLVPSTTYRPFIASLKGNSSGYSELRLNPDIDGTPGKISIGTPFTRSATNALEVAGSILSDATVFANSLSATSATLSGGISAATGAITSATIPTLASTSLTATSATIPTLTSTSLNATSATIPTLSSTTLNAAALTCTNASITNLTCTALTLSSASFPTLSATNATFTNASIGTLVSTSANVTSATVPTLNTTTFRVGSSTITGTGINTYTIPNLASSNFVLSEGAQTINGTKTFASAVITTGSVGTLTSTSANITTGSVATLTSTSANITSATVPTLTTTTFRVGSSTITGTGTNTYTIPAIASSNFVLSEGTQTINGAKTFSSTNTFTNNVIMSASAMTTAVPVLDLTITGASTTHGIRIGGNNAAPATPCIQFNNTVGNASQAFINFRNGPSAANTISIRTPDLSALGALISYTIPNVSTNADFIMSQGAQTLSGVKTFASNPIMSSLTASQAIVTNASKALASLAYTNLSTASTLVQRDTNGDFETGAITLGTGTYLPCPTGGGGTLLDHYEEYTYGSLDGVFQGIWGANQNANINCIRVGKMVTLYFTGFTAAATVASVITWSGIIKTRHQPTTDTFAPAVIVNNSSTQNAGGRIRITAVGAITIGASSTGGNFTASGNGGIASFSVSYFTT